MTIRNKKSVFGIIFGLFITDILGLCAVYDLSRQNALQVTFFDVGQGDSAFIQTQSRHQVLIDGGPGSIVLQKLSKEMPFWDRTIDLIILSHPESDHLTGLLSVLKNYKVENILWTGIVRDTPEYKEWETLIKEEGARIEIAKAGKRIYFSDSESDQYIEVLYPFESLEGKNFKDSNDISIVNKLVFRENSFLFPGDIYKSAEEELVKKESDIDADVLKISHHGSKTSSKEEFIEKVSPSICVISVGKNNSYGHPHKETLEVLEKYDTTILRTDLLGDVKIISDGKKLTF